MISTPPTDAWNQPLLEALEATARDAGFDAVGLAEADPAEEDHRFTEWIETGRAGEMDWLKRRDHHGTLVRAAVRVALPWARSVIVCAINYHADAPLSIDPADPAAGWIARYAWSGRKAGDELLPTDYHEDLLERLRRVEQALQQQAPCQTRSYVDTGPIVERTAAEKAGIGWVGKNTCILRQDTGSWLLLGVIVTSLPLAPDAPRPTLAPDRCGSCTRCLDACPTHALIAPRQMDASLCIAYLTIEKKGEIPEHLRAPIGRNVFGCDICQDVCPWNTRAPVAVKIGLETRAALVNPPLARLAALDAPAFRRLFKSSPLERTGRKRLHRNVAIAMGNSGDSSLIPQLETWAAGEDRVLASTAAWALERLRHPVPPPPSATLKGLPVRGNDADQDQ